ncbi:MAG: hypothetical protein AAB400_03000 [Patescibacteria group bacterium]
MSNTNVEFDCSHDPSNPDHLLCIQNNKANNLKLPEESRNGSSIPAIEIKDVSIDQEAARTFIDILKDRYNTYYHPNRKQFLIHWIVDISLAVLTLVLIAFIAYIQLIGPLFSSQLVLKFTQDTPTIISGAVASFTLTIKNTNGTSISNPVLSINVPRYFTILEPVSDSPAQTVTLPLPNIIRKNETLTIHIKGTIAGEIHERQSITASAKGELPDGSVSDSVAEILTYEISDSALEIGTDFPDRIILLNTFEGGVIITNRSSVEIQDIVAFIDMPSSFVGKPNNDAQKEIRIPLIEPHESYQLPIKGSINRSSQDRSVDISLSLKRNGQAIIQRRSELLLPIEKNDLAIELGFQNKPTSLAPGTPYNVNLTWKNTSNTELSNIQLGIDLEGYGITSDSLISATALQPTPFRRLWTRNQVSKLDILKPGEEHALQFNLKPSDVHSIRDLAGDSKLEITMKPFASYFSKNVKYTVTDTPIHMPIDTQASIKGSIRYYSPEGDQIGRGSLPPRSGKTTRYVFFISASSSIHPLENAVLKAVVSQNTTIATILPTLHGESSYDKKSNTITWHIGTLSATLAQPERQVGLAVQIDYTPLTDASTGPSGIIKEIILTGTDAITHAPISVSADINSLPVDVKRLSN